METQERGAGGTGRVEPCPWGTGVGPVEESYLEHQEGEPIRQAPLVVVDLHYWLPVVVVVVEVVEANHLHLCMQYVFHSILRIKDITLMDYQTSPHSQYNYLNLGSLNPNASSIQRFYPIIITTRLLSSRLLRWVRPHGRRHHMRKHHGRRRRKETCVI